jgi:hypothetical protein
MSLADRIREIFASNPDQPLSLEPPQPEVVEGDGHMSDYDPSIDPMMIEVRTPRYRDLVDGRGETAWTWRLREGYTVTYRRREPNEKELAFVTLPAEPLPVEKAEADETYEEWRARILRDGANGRSRADAVKVGPGAAQPSTLRPSYAERTSRFAMYDRNEGVLRWWE